MVAHLCKHVKNHWTVHFKRVDFMVCKFYLNKAIKHTRIWVFIYSSGILHPCQTHQLVLVAFVKITVPTGKGFLSKKPHFPHTKNICAIQRKPEAPDFRPEAWVLGMESPKMGYSATVPCSC